MKRKIVKQGAATLMISLPAKWAKAQNLDKGGEVDIEEKGNTLSISATSQKEKKEITLEINNENKEDITNLLTHSYRRGFDKIIIKGKELPSKEINKSVHDLLLGFENTSQNSQQVIIENISEPTTNKFETMLNQTLKIIEETQQLILHDFQNNSFKGLQDITDLKLQCDRYLLYCRRSLIKDKSEMGIVTQWEIITTLMYIQHQYFYLYKYLSENKIKKNPKIILLFEKVIEYFKLFNDAYQNKNMNLIHKINKLKEELYFGETIKQLTNSKKEETIILAYIREILRKIQLGTSPIISYILEKKTT